MCKWIIKTQILQNFNWKLMKMCLWFNVTGVWWTPEMFTVPRVRRVGRRGERQRHCVLGRVLWKSSSVSKEWQVLTYCGRCIVMIGQLKYVVNGSRLVTNRKAKGRLNNYLIWTIYYFIVFGCIILKLYFSDHCWNKALKSGLLLKNYFLGCF